MKPSVFLVLLFSIIWLLLSLITVPATRGRLRFFFHLWVMVVLHFSACFVLLLPDTINLWGEDEQHEEEQGRMFMGKTRNTNSVLVKNWTEAVPSVGQTFLSQSQKLPQQPRDQRRWISAACVLFQAAQKHLLGGSAVMPDLSSSCRCGLWSLGSFLSLCHLSLSLCLCFGMVIFCQRERRRDGQPLWNLDLVNDRNFCQITGLSSRHPIITFLSSTKLLFYLVLSPLLPANISLFHLLYCVFNKSPVIFVLPPLFMLGAPNLFVFSASGTGRTTQNLGTSWIRPTGTRWLISSQTQKSWKSVHHKHSGRTKMAACHRATENITILENG